MLSKDEYNPVCRDCQHARRVQGYAGYVYCPAHGWQIKGRAACCEFVKQVKE